MKKLICSHEIITTDLLPHPSSFRSRLATFLGRDFKLKREVERILENRTKTNFRSRWKDLGDCRGVFILLHELKSVLHSKNEYFMPEDSFPIIVQSYGQCPCEIYEFLRDVFFRKDPRYKRDWSDLYIGVPLKIKTMSLGQLVHHFKLLRSVRKYEMC